jgi:hypothetical protein
LGACVVARALPHTRARIESVSGEAPPPPAVGGRVPEREAQSRRPQRVLDSRRWPPGRTRAPASFPEGARGEVRVASSLCDGLEAPHKAPQGRRTLSLRRRDPRQDGFQSRVGLAFWVTGKNARCVLFGLAQGSPGCGGARHPASGPATSGERASPGRRRAPLAAIRSRAGKALASPNVRPVAAGRAYVTRNVLAEPRVASER